MKNKSTRVLSLILAFLLVLSCVPTYALDYSIAEVTGTNTITLQGEDLQEWLKENQGVRNSKVEKKSGIFEKAWMFVKDFVLPNEAKANGITYGLGSEDDLFAVTGSFDEETGVFTISGSGEMRGYVNLNLRPHHEI